MSKNNIINLVKKIRNESTEDNEEEQIDKYNKFFIDNPAIFWMARDKTMDIKRLEWMLDLKNKIDNGELNKEDTDKAMGLMMFKEYVEPKIK
jgi:hypothetical protein